MGILSAFRFAFQNLFFTPILYGVIASLAVFSTIWDTGDRFKDQLTDRFRSQEETFDFIIVGGGSAGAVLANRLSQYHTVLLLEAGGETHPFQAIPGLAIFIPKNPGTDWMHKSIPQTKSCLSCRHKKYILSQGRNLGGSGNIDYMIWNRGNPLDFNNWATITGDPAWGYDGVLPYFIQSEHFIGDTTDKTAHGYGGPLQIQIPDCIGLANEWNLAGEEMGYPHIDLNGRHSEGFDTVFYPTKQGVRQATYRSYIQPVRSRPSLLIRKFAHVNKILIREATNEAYGVEYDRHGHRKHAFANKEVIISAGTLQTPKLLVLSGVGQLEHLKALRIPVKSVLPVGKNLQDHIGTLLGPFYINKPRTISFDRDVDKQSFVTFATSGKGPLSTTGFQATAVFTSSLAKAQGQAGWPDIQITLFGLTPHRMFYSDIAHAFGIRQDILHRYYGEASGKENAFFIMVTLARPVSKGDYCVSRNDAYKPPVIDPNYLMDPDGQDIRVLVEGVHRALFLAENSTAFRALETWYTEKCFPGCEKVPFRSDAYWECYIRHFSVAMNDHVGTCPMGKIGSPYAVVDPELHVQGIKGLRVVDASVMPTIVGTPTQAATIMIAEKASSLILNKWKHDAKALYGVPGKKPGPPLSQYGPPGVPGPNYGPPGSTPGPPIQQYGPPGAAPAPIGVGDGFSNYDSFSVIRDQLNPTPGGLGAPPTPTPLIPLTPPDPQIWSTPLPFPNSPTAKPGPPYINGIASTQAPLLSPEPSQVLVPPGQLPTSPGPTYATSFSNSNIDFTGSIISTTPEYTAASFNLDRSANVDDNDRVDTQASEGGNVTVNGTRRGKSFGKPVVESLPEGNQLGHGELEDEDLLLPTTTPASLLDTFFSSAATTAQTPNDNPTTAVSEVVSQGPGFRVIRKRIRTTPRVVVHPRGHLGHQTVERKERKKFNESIENLLLTTSSIRPVPKNIVKIRRRRPVPFRRRTTTPIPSTSEAETLQHGEEDFEGITKIYGGGFDYTSTGPPPTEIAELRSPSRKRFVRRMYARPLNFNGKRRLNGIGVKNEYIALSTVSAPITITAPPDVVKLIATTTSSPPVEEEEPDEFEERADNVDEEVTTPYPIDITEDNISGESKVDETIGSLPTEEAVTVPPVVIFKNIELEDTEELSRKTRSNDEVANATKARKSDYFEYSLVSSGVDETRNPIMLVDLNPVPEIIAPKAIMSEIGHEGQHETVAIPMEDDEDGEKESETEEDSDREKLDEEDTTETKEYYDGSGDVEDIPTYSNEEALEAPQILVNASVTQDKGEDENKSSLHNSLNNTISQIDSNSSNLHVNYTTSVKYSVVVSSSSSSRNSSGDRKLVDKNDKVLQTLNKVNSTTTVAPDSTYEEDDYSHDYSGDGGDKEDTALSPPPSTSPTITTPSKLSPRNFRMMSKLIRSHS